MDLLAITALSLDALRSPASWHLLQLELQESSSSWERSYFPHGMYYSASQVIILLLKARGESCHVLQ